MGKKEMIGKTAGRLGLWFDILPVGAKEIFLGGKIMGFEFPEMSLRSCFVREISGVCHTTTSFIQSRG